MKTHYKVPLIKCDTAKVYIVIHSNKLGKKTRNKPKYV